MKSRTDRPRKLAPRPRKDEVRAGRRQTRHAARLACRFY